MAGGILSEIADPVAASIVPLAHCAECDLWLRPDEACLHIPRSHRSLRARADAPQGVGAQSLEDAGDDHTDRLRPASPVLARLHSGSNARA